MIQWMILLVLVILVLLFQKSKEGMTTIPPNLFQTWYTKSLPPHMKACVERLQQQNPDFKHVLYDDEECRTFIARHFRADVLYSFDALLPGAYKADLWRYCVLYIHGGIYLDIKFECVKSFKLVTLLNKTHYVLDRQNYAERGKILVYNGCIVSPAKNLVLKLCIDRIVDNVRKSEFGYNPLYPTGPGLLGEVLDLDPDIDLNFSMDGTSIVQNKKPILRMYPQYREEQAGLRANNHYNHLWKQGTIYQP